METVLIISSIALWGVVLVNLLLTFALIRRINADARSKQENGLKAGERAPAFTAQTLQGDLVTQAAYVGRKVAFVFISTHCDPCRAIMPQLESLKPNVAQAGVDLVLVSVDEQAETVKFIEEQHISLPVLVAPRPANHFLTDYKMGGTPSYCLVDEQGTVKEAGYTSLDWGIWKVWANSSHQEDVRVPEGRRN